MPLWNEFIFINSSCIEVLLAHKHWAEPDIVIAPPFIAIEREYTGISAVATPAPAFRERIVRVHEVGVVRCNPYINFGR